MTHCDRLQPVSSVDATQVAQTELTSDAVDEERVRDGHVQLWTDERRQLVRLLRVTDKHVDVVDTSATQWADISTRTPTVNSELSATGHQWRSHVPAH